VAATQEEALENPGNAGIAEKTGGKDRHYPKEADLSQVLRYFLQVGMLDRIEKHEEAEDCGNPEPLSRGYADQPFLPQKLKALHILGNAGGPSPDLNSRIGPGCEEPEEGESRSENGSRRPEK